jgi:hypothetical protein
MIENIVRTIESNLNNGVVLLKTPENIPKGVFLHLVSSNCYPLIAEGVVPISAATRNRRAQAATSTCFNVLERNMIHASHMIPRNLGGSGETYNLMALPRHFNTCQIRDFERQVEAAVTSSDHYLQVFAGYTGTQRIPTEVVYRLFRLHRQRPEKVILEKRFFILQ